MTNVNLYNKIQNPLNKRDIMDDLIKAFATPSFSKTILKLNSASGEVVGNKKEANKLHTKLFNSWKRSILTLTPEQIRLAISRGIYDKSIYKLYDLLRVTHDATSIKEVNEVLTGDYKDKDLLKAISEYRWDKNSTFTETTINAKDVYAKKFPSQKPEHALFINCANYDLHKIANIFVDKCTAMNLPYYFKISEYENCDDKITIYSDSEKLYKTIEVLRQIEKEHPEIIKRCGQTPVLSGQITNWLGYGKVQLNSKGQQDFHSQRIKVIEKSIDEVLRAWYKENKDQMEIKGKDNESVSLIEYLSLQICKDELDKMMKLLPKTDYEKQSNMKKYGYTEQTLRNPEFRKNLFNIMTAEITKMIGIYSNNMPLSTDIVLRFSNGRNYTISKDRIMDEIKKSIKMVAAVDPSFAGKVKNKIIENSNQAGIDSTNYCFDRQITKKMDKTAFALEQQESIKKLAQQYGCQYPREKHPTETAEQYSMYLKLYCMDYLKPAMDSKNQLQNTTQPVAKTKQPTTSKPKSSQHYTQMTENDIIASQKKLGVYIPPSKK